MEFTIEFAIIVLICSCAVGNVLKNFIYPSIKSIVNEVNNENTTEECLNRKIAMRIICIVSVMILIVACIREIAYAICLPSVFKYTYLKTAIRTTILTSYGLGKLVILKKEFKEK